MNSIIDIWNQKEAWFRDELQLERVAAILVDRLADDRVQDECRYLMRLHWHFRMGYQEVSYSELLRFVSDSKMAILDGLFDKIAAHDYSGIDDWAEYCEGELPIVDDRWRGETFNG